MKNNLIQADVHGASTKPKKTKPDSKKKIEGTTKELTDGYEKTQLIAEQEELRERFLFIIETWAADRYRYEWLEKRTGIPAARWQNVLLEKQLPTLEMLIAACRNRPQYTYWLMNGTKRLQQQKENARGVLGVESTYPPEDVLNKFKNDREWIKERRKANTATKKPLD